MNKRFFEIKRSGKQALKGHFGLALLVTFVPAIIFGILGSFAAFIFGIISIDLGDIMDLAITTYGTFISLTLLISLFKGKTNFTSEDYFFFDDRVLQYFLLSLILFALGFSVIIPFYSQIQSITQLPSVILREPEYLRTLMQSITPMQAIGSLIASIITAYISIRLIFAPYIIIDQHLKVMDAIKKSWTYTRGKFWYLFFFPLSFILWYLLIIPTLFLILLYLIPYIGLSYVALYFEFKQSNNDGEIPIYETEEVVEVDILDDEIYR